MIRQPDASFKAQRSGTLPPAGDPRHHETAQALISRARQHPLGIEFLEKGAPDAVAATFEVHAFTVDRARELLHGRG